MKRTITSLILLIFCPCMSFVFAHTLKTDEAQLDSLVNELRVLGAMQAPEEIDYIPPQTEEEYNELVEYSRSLPDSISTCDDVSYELVQKESEKECPLVTIDTFELIDPEHSDLVTNAIKFAEKFIVTAYDDDLAEVETMVHPFAKWMLNDDCSVYKNVLSMVFNEWGKLKCTSYSVIDADICGNAVIDVIFRHYPNTNPYIDPLCIRVLGDNSTGMYYILTFINTDESKVKYLQSEDVTVKVLPTEDLAEIENQLTSNMDALGAIRFAENFLQAAYDFDFSSMKMMVCSHPSVLSFFTEEMYPFAIKPMKRDGMYLNAQKGIYSKCEGINDLDLSTFSAEDIPGYYKANVYFDAFPMSENAEFVSLRVMVFQNIEDGSFSIYSIK